MGLWPRVNLFGEPVNPYALSLLQWDQDVGGDHFRRGQLGKMSMHFLLEVKEKGAAEAAADTEY